MGTTCRCQSICSASHSTECLAIIARACAILPHPKMGCDELKSLGYSPLVFQAPLETFSQWCSLPSSLLLWPRSLSFLLRQRNSTSTFETTLSLQMASSAGEAFWPRRAWRDSPNSSPCPGQSQSMVSSLGPVSLTADFASDPFVTSSQP